MNDDVRAKLEKIKRLADDAKDKPEGIAALAMFQRLLKKYGVDESEIAGYTPNDVQRRVIHESGRVAGWILALASVIARQFRCAPFYARTPGNTAIIFDGLPDDLDIAESAFTAACSVIRRMARTLDVSNARWGASEARNSYRLGFITGLELALKRQAASGELGMILVTPEIVARRMEGKKQHDYNADAYDATNYHKGRKDGEGYLDKRRIGG